MKGSKRVGRVVVSADVAGVGSPLCDCGVIDSAPLSPKACYTKGSAVRATPVITPQSYWGGAMGLFGPPDVPEFIQTPECAPQSRRGTPRGGADDGNLQAAAQSTESR